MYVKAFFIGRSAIINKAQERQRSENQRVRAAVQSQQQVIGEPNTEPTAPPVSAQAQMGAALPFIAVPVAPATVTQA